MNREISRARILCHADKPKKIEKGHEFDEIDIQEKQDDFYHNLLRQIKKIR